jgi:hypothetical protein
LLPYWSNIGMKCHVLTADSIQPVRFISTPTINSGT